MSIEEQPIAADLVEGPAETVDGFPILVDEPGPSLAPEALPVEAVERVGSVDVIRGMALLGILAMNIVGFARPGNVYGIPILDPDAGRADLTSWRLNHLVFDTKMMTLFSMLFGAGLVLMSDRAEGRGARMRGVYYRRVACLLAIGLIHSYLIRDGDVLVMYASTGFLLCPVRRWPARTLIVVDFCLNLLLVPLLLGFRLGAVPSMRTTAERVDAEIKAGRKPKWWEEKVRDGWKEMSKTEMLKREGFLKQIAARREGDWPIVKGRARSLIWGQTFGFVLVGRWFAGGRMLVGMGLMKLGVFSAARSRRAYLTMMAVGYGVGLPLMAFDAIHRSSHGFHYHDRLRRSPGGRRGVLAGDRPDLTIRFPRPMNPSVAGRSDPVSSRTGSLPLILAPRRRGHPLRSGLGGADRHKLNRLVDDARSTSIITSRCRGHPMSGSTRSVPGARASRRPSPRRRAAISPERLESRALLSGASPTDAEQYMLELINRARANPAAEGQRLLSLAQTDPTIRSATSGWDLGLFYRTISSYPAEPPLAFNPRLIDAALAEDASMLARNGQRHSPSGFLTDPAVAVDTDGQAYYPTGSGWWATGENIFAFSANVAGESQSQIADYFEEGFLLDWGNPDFGHLKNLLAPGPAEANPSGGVYPHNEVGVGLIYNVTPTAPPDPNPLNPGNAGLGVGPALVTQEFGWRQGDAFLTGTFYRDAPGTQFYAPGEGIGGVAVTAVGLGGQGTFQAQTWSSGGYSLQLPAGTYRVTASGGVPGTPSTTVTIGQDNVAWGAGFAAIPPQADIAVPADYDGIGRSDLATYQPSTGIWFIASPVTGSRAIVFGMPGDVPVPGRYDGGGKAEIAVFRPSTATFYILGPAGARAIQWGVAGDVPVPGDYDGDGVTDLAVYRPSTAIWYVWDSRTQALQVKQFGAPGLDQPVQAAYDGGGIAEIAVLRPTTFQWFILGPAGIRYVQFGVAGTVPVPAPYDGGGKAEIAVYQPSTATYFVWDDGMRVTLGSPGTDQPAPADYDGDGKADVAVFRPGTAGWLIDTSRGGSFSLTYGQAGVAQTLKQIVSETVPVPSAWASWVGSAAAESDAGHGPAPTTTVRPPSPRRPINQGPIRRPIRPLIDDGDRG